MGQQDIHIKLGTAISWSESSSDAIFLRQTKVEFLSVDAKLIFIYFSSNLLHFSRIRLNRPLNPVLVRTDTLISRRSTRVTPISMNERIDTDQHILSIHNGGQWPTRVSGTSTFSLPAHPRRADCSLVDTPRIVRLDTLLIGDRPQVDHQQVIRNVSALRLSKATGTHGNVHKVTGGGSGCNCDEFPLGRTGQLDQGDVVKGSLLFVHLVDEVLRAGLGVGHTVPVGTAQSHGRLLNVSDAVGGSKNPVLADQSASAEFASSIRELRQRREEGGLKGNLTLRSLWPEDDRGTWRGRGGWEVGRVGRGVGGA